MGQEFAPGVEVRALPDGHTLLSFSNGRNFSLNIPTIDFFRLVDAWRHGFENPALPSTWREDSQPLQDLLQSHGAFAPTVAQPEPSAAPASQRLGSPVLIGGDAEMVALITTAIQPEHRAIHATGDYAQLVSLAAAEDSPLIVCHPSADDLGFTCLARLATTARVSWVPVTVERDSLWVGPLILPGRGAQFQDLHERRIAAADHEVIIRSLREQPLNGARMVPTAWKYLRQVADLLRRTLSTSDLLGQLRLADGSVTDHVVLPVPRHPDVTHNAHGIEDMVSQECGIVTRVRPIEHHPSVPSSLRTIQVDVAHMARISAWDDVISCQGSTWNDVESARLAALGETAERYAANRHDTLPMVESTFRRLNGSGRRALDPDSLVLHSQQQYDTPGFPAAPFTKDTELAWVAGWSETRAEEVMIPAQLVHTNWRKGKRIHEPIVSISPFAGVAAGPNREFAMVSAIEELVERHATMLWWLNALPLPRLRTPAELAELWRNCPSQEATLIALPNEFGIPVAAGVLREKESQLLNVGFAARDTIESAGLKAWSEAITLQEGSRDLLSPDSLHLRAIREGLVPAGAMRPHRTDRRYLDDFRPDFTDCTDLMVQQQIYLDPRAQERVSHLVNPTSEVDPASVARLPHRSVAAYRARIEEKGHEILWVDITPPDISSLGLCVVRVIIPGLIGNAAAAFPLLGGNRVFTIPVELGLVDTPREETTMNRMPLPHA